MKVTRKMLRALIEQEVQSLNENFSPIGGIGFGPTPATRRSSYLDLPIMDESDNDETASYTNAELGIRHGHKPTNEAQQAVKELIDRGIDLKEVMKQLVDHLHS